MELLYCIWYVWNVIDDTEYFQRFYEDKYRWSEDKFMNEEKFDVYSTDKTARTICPIMWQVALSC